MTLRCTFLLSGESNRHPHLGNPTLGKPSFASVLYFEGGTDIPLTRPVTAGSPFRLNLSHGGLKRRLKRLFLLNCVALTRRNISCQFHEGLHDDNYMQTGTHYVTSWRFKDSNQVSSLSQFIVAERPTKAEANKHTHTHPILYALPSIHTCKGPTHTLLFILRGSFSEPSPTQGTQLLVHQHNACP